MTSTQTADYPEYQFVPTVITSNGQPLASQYMANGTVVTDVSLSKKDQAKKKKLENLLDEYESSINIFSPELTEQMQSIAKAKQQSAIDDFNSVYEPAYNSAREDYFSRLGTLDSTAYLDRANRLEETRQNAYADIANDYVANLDTLQNNELSRRYAYLDYLQNSLNTLNGETSDYLDSISSIGSNYTNSYNNYLNSLYNSQNSSSSTNWGQIAKLTTLGISYL